MNVDYEWRKSIKDGLPTASIDDILLDKHGAVKASRPALVMLLCMAAASDRAHLVKHFIEDTPYCVPALVRHPKTDRSLLRIAVGCRSYSVVRYLLGISDDGRQHSNNGISRAELQQLMHQRDGNQRSPLDTAVGMCDDELVYLLSGGGRSGFSILKWDTPEDEELFESAKRAAENRHPYLIGMVSQQVRAARVLRILNRFRFYGHENRLNDEILVKELKTAFSTLRPRPPRYVNNPIGEGGWPDDASPGHSWTRQERWVFACKLRSYAEYGCESAIEFLTDGLGIDPFDFDAELKVSLVDSIALGSIDNDDHKRKHVSCWRDSELDSIYHNTWTYSNLFYHKWDASEQNLHEFCESHLATIEKPDEYPHHIKAAALKYMMSLHKDETVAPRLRIMQLFIDRFNLRALPHRIDKLVKFGRCSVLDYLFNKNYLNSNAQLIEDKSNADSSESSNKEEEEEEEVCCICMDVPRQRMALECGHAMCRQCVRLLFEERGNFERVQQDEENAPHIFRMLTTCPLCRREVYAPPAGLGDYLGILVTNLETAAPEFDLERMTIGQALLALAVKFDAAPTVVYLIETQGVAPARFTVDTLERTILHVATANKSFLSLKWLCSSSDRCRSIVMSRCTNGQMALHEAIESGDADAVRLLLSFNEVEQESDWFDKLRNSKHHSLVSISEQIHGERQRKVAERLMTDLTANAVELFDVIVAAHEADVDAMCTHYQPLDDVSELKSVQHVQIACVMTRLASEQMQRQAGAASGNIMLESFYPNGGRVSNDDLLQCWRYVLAFLLNEKNAERLEHPSPPCSNDTDPSHVSVEAAALVYKWGQNVVVRDIFEQWSQDLTTVNESEFAMWRVVPGFQDAFKTGASIDTINECIAEFGRVAESAHEWIRPRLIQTFASPYELIKNRLSGGIDHVALNAASNGHVHIVEWLFTNDVLVKEMSSSEVQKGFSMAVYGAWMKEQKEVCECLFRLCVKLEPQYVDVENERDRISVEEFVTTADSFVFESIPFDQKSRSTVQKEMYCWLIEQDIVEPKPRFIRSLASYRDEFMVEGSLPNTKHDPFLLDVIKVLVRRGVDFGHRYKDEPPIQSLINAGFLDIVRWLVENGHADIRDRVVGTNFRLDEDEAQAAFDLLQKELGKIAI